MSTPRRFREYREPYGWVVCDLNQPSDDGLVIVGFANSRTEARNLAAKFNREPWNWKPAQVTP